ncbi:DUF262 domain-containing protein [Bradyrhizobium sp. CCGB01]|uniref:DUF262 domain-containing protein n=1 Tax=Bradyrhizobium sp. CCGB01 TaxID=2949634 RepID=UPI0020B1B113|nr:DUF262 domain-containing protein [Bradyrhizobium sp. CCGB01]MCP3412041.1 DUF262 domain-containing protein [Bradyrhizobium sp. CCGB01]
MTKESRKKPEASGKTQQSEGKHLHDFEKVPFDHDTTKSKSSDEELNSRYAKGEVRIVTEQARYPLAGILGMLRDVIEDEDGEKELRYKLDPEYQRRHRWSNERKSRLIESFLMNVPVPPVFLYERDLARFEVMDGRQRLTALSDFYADKFELIGLQYWSDLDGRKYSQLPSKIRDGIDRRYISSIILLKETAASEEQAAMLKKMVFERLNSGGVKLGSQETRNAVYNGPLNKLCLDLSENEKFRRMWGIPLDPKPEETNDDEEVEEATDDSTTAGLRMFEKMEDAELVLRFFAYRKIGEFKAGLNKISEFLDRFIVAGNKFPEKGLAEYRAMFEETIQFLWEVLGVETFTVLDPSKRRPTKIVYDPLMFVANSPGVVPHRAELVANKVVLRDELKEMYQKNQGLFSGRRTNFKDTQDRNRCVSEAFSNAIAKTAK